VDQSGSHKKLWAAGRPAAPHVPQSLWVCNFSSPRACLLTRVLQALAVVSAAGWLYGCGVQGPPRPPRLERPARITNLSVVQVGQTLEVRFSVPQQASDGERLTKPLEVEILRGVAPQGTGVSKLPESEVWMRLTRNEWLPYAQGDEVSYPAHLTEQEFRTWRGQTLVLAVRTLTRGFRHRALESDPSNWVDVPIFDVSEPVGGVTAVTTEKALEVRFAPPTTMLSGQPVHGLGGYRIYRSNTGARGSFEMIGETAAPPYRDRQFEFGHTYYYRVRAIFGEPGHWAMSDDSQLAKITPRDTFPPAAPQGLTGIYAAGGVELVWTANSESDLAGYNVYRLENPPPRRLNGELLRTPVFRDTNAEPGKTLTYYVTAVDLAGNESKPSEKVEVETK
jgi:hypothetical protein